MTTIQEVAKEMKDLYEKAAIHGGRDEQHSLIRSQKLINVLHEFIKKELVENGINKDKIFPPIGDTKPELCAYGFLKKKSQDITVLPSPPEPSNIEEGVLEGSIDKIGKDVMEKAITINIRSQLSSLAKNFDTLYERTFAEALNLHLRVPKMVLGEVYMVPVYGYDPNELNNNKIAWKEKLPKHYIPAFSALNNRESTEIDEFKYERLALLVIDFSKDVPVIVEDNKYLVEEGIIEESEKEEYSLEGLTINNFVKDLIKIYVGRYGSIDDLS